MDTTKKRVPTLNERKQAIFFKIFELVKKRGKRFAKSNSYGIERKDNCKNYIQINNNDMVLTYIRRKTVMQGNINDLESCDIAVLKDCLMDVIYAMRNK